MPLQLLQEVVHGQLDVAIVEPDDHSERDHVLAHRVDEGTAELAVLGCGSQWPAHRVDDPVQRTRDLPHLLHAERPDLRVLAGKSEVVERDAREMALRPFREHRHPRGEVGAGLEVAELLALAPTSLVAGPHAAHATVGRKQLHRRRLGKDHRAAFLRLLREPAAEP